MNLCSLMTNHLGWKYSGKDSKSQTWRQTITMTDSIPSLEIEYQSPKYHSPIRANESPRSNSQYWNRRLKLSPYLVLSKAGGMNKRMTLNLTYWWWLAIRIPIAFTRWHLNPRTISIIHFPSSSILTWFEGIQSSPPQFIQIFPNPVSLQKNLPFLSDQRPHFQTFSGSFHTWWKYLSFSHCSNQFTYKNSFFLEAMTFHFQLQDSCTHSLS
jgi:hypothetical protein